MTTKKPASAQPKVYLIDDDPVAMFLLVDLVESVDLPHVALSSAVEFLKQEIPKVLDQHQAIVDDPAHWA